MISHMFGRMQSRSIVSACVAFGFALGAGAAAKAQAPGAPRRPPEFVSPEVLADRAVVFRVHAPESKAVRLSSSDMPGLGRGAEAKKNDQGVWEAKVGPVAPGTYRYLFQIDGLAVVDPRNPKTSESNANTFSLATVPGSTVSDLTDVPHGATAEVVYFSKTLGKFRRMHVYTPPGYDRATTPLPVFYLLHGASDSDASWSTVGRAGLVIDNLIAAGKARPMIVVMPMGHTGPFSFGPGNSFQNQMSEFARDFIHEVRPYVERTYRVSTARADRAIAGLSMGGAQTLDIAFTQPADYGWVGVFSSGVFGLGGRGPGGGDGGTAWIEAHAKGLDDAEARKGLKLLWFATGKEDFLLDTTRATVEMFRKRGFEPVYEETDGGHTWIKWREDYLPKFAAAIFPTSAN
ncbi:MAG: alpha/beta hydrolase-fold protein [Isosphaeraceae bacterium]|nr:alpha/beta hydrolase-fold protein [Isosphaeraceae bacterium]